MTLSKQELESKLWQAADILRGQIDAADYKNYIFSISLLETALRPVQRRSGQRRCLRRFSRRGHQGP